MKGCRYGDEGECIEHCECIEQCIESDSLVMVLGYVLYSVRVTSSMKGSG